MPRGLCVWVWGKVWVLREVLTRWQDTAMTTVTRSCPCALCFPSHPCSRFSSAFLLLPLKPDHSAISLWKGVKKCCSSSEGNIRMPGRWEGVKGRR